MDSATKCFTGTSTHSIILYGCEPHVAASLVRGCSVATDGWEPYQRSSTGGSRSPTGKGSCETAKKFCLFFSCITSWNTACVAAAIGGNPRHLSGCRQHMYCFHSRARSFTDFPSSAQLSSKERTTHENILILALVLVIWLDPRDNVDGPFVGWFRTRAALLNAPPPPTPNPPHYHKGV